MKYILISKQFSRLTFLNHSKTIIKVGEQTRFHLIDHPNKKKNKKKESTLRKKIS